MPRRNGFFRRIGEPVILTIGRSNQVVKTGDVILADFDSMMEKHGWKFEPKFDPAKEKMEIQKANAQKQQLQQKVDRRQIPQINNQVPPAQNLPNQLIEINGFQRREMTTQPRQKSASESMIDQRYAELIESNTIKIGSIADLDERVNRKQTSSEIEVNFDALKELKNYSNKDWLKITKEKAIEILEAAHIDYSHLSKERWEYIKFLKSIVKDIP